MSAKRHERTHARRGTLQILYQGDILDEQPSSIVDQGCILDDGSGLSAYARELLAMCDEHKLEIDERLKTISENWTLERMPVVDRSILRLAACEMMYVDDVPLSVSINEAVELAKDFGGEDDSPRFVNGVLGRLAATLSGEEGELGEEAGELDAATGEPVDEATDSAEDLADSDIDAQKVNEEVVAAE